MEVKKQRKHLIIPLLFILISLFAIVTFGYLGNLFSLHISIATGTLALILLWAWKPMRKPFILFFTIISIPLWTYTTSFVTGYKPCEITPCPSEWIRYYKRRKECLAKGDSWVPGGISMSYHCVHYYKDSGQECISSDECEGDCLVGDRFEGERVKGNCEENDSYFGCKGVPIENCPQGGCLGWCAD